MSVLRKEVNIIHNYKTALVLVINHSHSISVPCDSLAVLIIKQKGRHTIRTHFDNTSIGKGFKYINRDKPITNRQIYK